ncbi:MAG: endonuclease [Bacteriovoracaceae bacterium]|nr:endonuclease [Bacteriovoracaceae bacterium]
MKKIVSMIVALMIPSLAWGGLSYYPTDIQNNFERGIQRNDVLKQTLFKVLSDYHTKVKGKNDLLGCKAGSKCYRHKSVGYRGARKVLFGKIHLEEDSRGYFVKDVYCRKEFTRSQTNVGPNVIPNSNVLNCEHTWPQSKFTGRFSKDLQKSDIHHLYPTDSKANSVRGNYNFADVNGNQAHSNCDASRVGSAKASSTRFEPPAEHKGNVARALFYFSVRYQIKINSSEEQYLREWHEQDPVDASERNRNEWIEKVQGNRNPFIDYPNIVDSIQDF